MLTIENIKSILNTKYGVIDQWTLIGISEMLMDDTYKFQFYKQVGQGHGQYEDMTLYRVGKLHKVRGKDTMAYKFSGALFTADYLRDKKNFKGIIENYLKTK